MRILTVCTGNICRSPIAEAILAHELGESFTVGSAGVAALTGSPADPFAREVCAERGFNLSPHIARPVELKLVLAQDIILTMERSHLKYLSRQYPQVHGRIFLLGNWQGKIEIPDPYGQSKAEFEDAFDLIRDCCRDWLKKLNA